MAAFRLRMEPWRVCKLVVADSHLFDEEQDPDPHLSDKSDPYPHKVMRICNTGTSTFTCTMFLT
jgi:hypothetical protein